MFCFFLGNNEMYRLLFMILLPIPTKRVLKRTHGMKLQLCCDLTIQEKESY